MRGKWVGLIGGLCFASNTWAVTPQDGVMIGIEPTRVYSQNAQIQQQMRHQIGWSKLRADFGENWSIRFDEATGFPRRLWGKGLPISNHQDGQAISREVIARLVPHAPFLGLIDNTLRLRAANYVERVDTWYLEWDSIVSGHPVYRGGVSARIKNGRLISIGFNTYGQEGQSGQAEWPQSMAVQQAIQKGAAPSSQHTNVTSSLMWLPLQTMAGVDLRLVWQVKSETIRPVGEWVSFVDASSGELLNTHNEVRFFAGSIYSKHHERNPGSSLITSPSPDQWVYTDRYEDYTDPSGSFEFSGDEEAEKTAELRGKYLRVFNEDGNEGRLRFTGDTATWTADSATQGEINSFTFLHQIRDWGAFYAPEVGMVSNPIRSYVNKTDGNCNAYYNGDLNFFAKDGNCNNTAQIADVNYHEWGHGFHYYSVSSGGGVVDGSVGEGASDVISILQTRDPVMARYFFTNGNGIRTANNDNRYPDDLVGEVHEDGTIFSGAMWDLIQIFSGAMGEDDAYKLTSTLTVGMLKGGPTLESTWDEIIVADDDDGDLSNGTPHYCQMLDAFGAHGLGPGAVSGSVILDHEPLENIDHQSDHEVSADLVLLASECIEFTPELAKVTYRVNGGDWMDSELSIKEMTVTGAIPQQSLGDFVEYYLVINGEDGSVATPPGQYVNPYSFFVGDVIELFCTDFEADDAGFSHKLISGSNSEGADDWQWGEPIGEGGDPDRAYSGDNVWGNDLGEDNYNGEYQNDKHNRLTSPAYELAHYEGVFLQYRRWLQVEDGYYDNSRILANGEPVWDNYDSRNEDGGYHHQDYSWVPHAVDLGLEWGTESVELAWEIESDGGLTLGGWTIDDVCLYAPATPNNRLAITDFQASDDIEGGITLSWTHPMVAPVDRVVVIRKADSFPSGPTDGAMVTSIVDPTPGEAATFTDTDVDGNREYFFAIYGFDGTDWLTWTVEGWNADIGHTTNMPTDEIEFSSGGCSCTVASAANPYAWGLFSVLLLGFSYRRRQNVR